MPVCARSTSRLGVREEHARKNREGCVAVHHSWKADKVAKRFSCLARD